MNSLRDKIYLSVADFKEGARYNDLFERVHKQMLNDAGLQEEFRQDDLQYARDWHSLRDVVVGTE